MLYEGGEALEEKVAADMFLNFAHYPPTHDNELPKFAGLFVSSAMSHVPVLLPARLLGGRSQGSGDSWGDASDCAGDVGGGGGPEGARHLGDQHACAACE